MKNPFTKQKKASELPIESDQINGNVQTLATLNDENESISGLSDFYIPEKDAQVTPKSPDKQKAVRDIADVLVEMGKLTFEQSVKIKEDLQTGKSKGGNNLEKVLLKTGLIDPEGLSRAKAVLFDLKYREIGPDDIDKAILEKFGIDFIRDNNIVPIGLEKNILVVGTTDPSNVLPLEEIRSRMEKDLELVVCSEESILTICESFSETSDESDLGDIITDMTDIEIVQEDKKDFEDMEKMAEQSPVIRFVNYLISHAIKEGASDIHIEAKDKNTEVRYRVDGILFKGVESPSKMHPAIVSRVKIMANLDISERRLPQDGKISVIAAGRAIDLRVSTLPMTNGEKVVIRVLDSNSIMRGLDNSGMEQDIKDIFSEQIKMPHGVLLVTGPTGSGKSTTLYSALCQMKSTELNVSTVEDPVEYELNFCNQVQTNDKIGLNFASALRSLLRQDPDIIMIGEIRDGETATIAVQAALTGHLVLSTLHTNDAASSVTRLVDIGVDPFLIAASLNAVLAQRLVRRICPECKKTYKITASMKKFLEQASVVPTKVFCGKGCEKCRGTGYSGRVGIYELMVIDEKFREIINKDVTVDGMRKAFHESGSRSLFEDGMKKVANGQTTIEEVLRVTEIDVQN